MALTLSDPRHCGRPVVGRGDIQMPVGDRQALATQDVGVLLADVVEDVCAHDGGPFGSQAFGVCSTLTTCPSGHQHDSSIHPSWSVHAVTLIGMSRQAVDDPLIVGHTDHTCSQQGFCGPFGSGPRGPAGFFATKAQCGGA